MIWLQAKKFLNTFMFLTCLFWKWILYLTLTTEFGPNYKITILSQKKLP